MTHSSTLVVFCIDMSLPGLVAMASAELSARTAVSLKGPSQLTTLCVLHAAKYRPHSVYTDARSILAIHNLRHQVGTRPAILPPAVHAPGLPSQGSPSQ